MLVPTALPLQVCWHGFLNPSTPLLSAVEEKRAVARVFLGTKLDFGDHCCWQSDAVHHADGRGCETEHCEADEEVHPLIQGGGPRRSSLGHLLEAQEAADGHEDVVAGVARQNQQLLSSIGVDWDHGPHSDPGPPAACVYSRFSTKSWQFSGSCCQS